MLQNPTQYIKSGKAFFTIQNVESGNRFTYKAKKADDKDIWFISVLNGPDNFQTISTWAAYSATISNSPPNPA